MFRGAVAGPPVPLKRGQRLLCAGLRRHDPPFLPFSFDHYPTACFHGNAPTRGHVQRFSLKVEAEEEEDVLQSI